MEEKELESRRGRLTREQYYVTQEKETEPPFSGAYHDHKEPGMYACIICGAVLFSSDAKYDSGTGWPSFYYTARKAALREKKIRAAVCKELKWYAVRAAHIWATCFPTGPCRRVTVIASTLRRWISRGGSSTSAIIYDSAVYIRNKTQ